MEKLLQREDKSSLQRFVKGGLWQLIISNGCVATGLIEKMDGVFKLQTKATLPDALSMFVYTVVWETIYAYYVSGPLTPKVIIEGIGKIENH